MQNGVVGGRKLKRIAAMALAAACLLAAPAGPFVDAGFAQSQEESWGGSYITPFPENDSYRVQVFGDFLADGLMSALSEGLSTDARVQMPRRQQNAPGLIRFEPNDFTAFEEGLGREPLHIAVIMFGVGDRIPMRGPNNRRVAVGSEEWKTEYARRIDRLVRILKQRGVAIYWVSLPIVRRNDMSEDVQMLNEVFRERTLLNNVKFIDVYETFADEQGKYNQYGPDLTGKTRLLREGDGVSFTAAGNRKLAHFVEREIKRDITQARADRTIPLAGGETEQRRISPKQQAQPQAAPQSGWGSSVTSAAKSKDAGQRSGPFAAQAISPLSATGDLKADTSKVAIKIPGKAGREETVNVEIVRPAIPASVVALVTRRASPDRPNQLGDNVPDTIGGSTMVLNSITPGLASGSQAQRQRLAPTQSPFFKVLVKGERLSPRPGRADDFRWPRPDAETKASGDARPAQSPPEPTVIGEGAPKG